MTKLKGDGYSLSFSEDHWIVRTPTDCMIGFPTKEEAVEAMRLYRAGMDLTPDLEDSAHECMIAIINARAARQ